VSLRIVAALLLPLALLACGVKTDLERPMMQVMQPQPQQNLINPQKDPSKPPTTLGEPGGTTPPYPIGP
jgi:hypothetical protein